MSRGRSTSPHPLRDADVDMEDGKLEKPHAKVVVVTNLTRNVVEVHLKTIFSFYGEITKIDLPLFGKCTFTVYRHLKLYSLNIDCPSRSKQRKSCSRIL
jgi:hypothetical protein